jgi:hypothetical protein
MNKITKIPLFLLLVTPLLFSACNGQDGVLPTSASTAVISPVNTEEIPPTNNIETPVFETTPESVTIPSESDIDAGAVITGDDFLPIDEILNEIDNDVCQNAYETKAELEALIEEGEELEELETAVEELIQELENCPTPTPTP